MDHLKPFLITMGDPAGVGLDAVCSLFKNMQSANIQSLEIAANDHPTNDQTGKLAAGALCLVSNLNAIKTRAKLWDIDIQIIDHPRQACLVKNKLPVLPVHAPLFSKIGCPSNLDKDCIFQSLQIAVKYCSNGLAKGVITNPIAKNTLGSGHTELLQKMLDVTDICMTFVNKHILVGLMTHHIPLSQVPAALLEHAIPKRLELFTLGLIHNLGITNPKIAVCGLNPHAGENGLLGMEEKDIIAPMLNAMQTKLSKFGVRYSVPLSPDTAFIASNRLMYDAFVCWYHDQGLIALKTLDFKHSAQWTMGLPIIRTSPDHGTAYSVAGNKGKVDHSGLLYAIMLAKRLADHAHDHDHDPAAKHNDAAKHDPTA